MLDSMPKVIPTGHCEKHGDYEYHYMDLSTMGLGYREISTCPKCSEEENRKREKEEEQKERERLDRIQEAHLTKAGIAPRYHNVKLGDFDRSTEKKEKAYKKCEKFCEDIFNGDSTGSLILTGKVGTGKTMICQGMLNALVPQKSCRMVKLIDLIRMIKDTWRKDSETSELQMLEYFSSIDLLIIDEVGMQFGSETESLFIFDVIDGRYQNMLPTVIISNLNIDGVKQILGERVIDRLRDGGGQLLAFDWDSARK
jgi:DNA replication protein DnaC